MTRKRFVKLMMARGYSRNEANRLAVAARGDGMTYAEASAKYPLKLPTHLLAKIAISFSAAVSAFVEAFKTAMNTEGEHERDNTHGQGASGLLCLSQARD